MPQAPKRKMAFRVCAQANLQLPHALRFRGELDFLAAGTYPASVSFSESVIVFSWSDFLTNERLLDVLGAGGSASSLSV